ncbi:MAG: hypothetical protein E7599_07285 [Ruminococcaceae bacterium]|nr:hypothetical protein [Oscillospiraceae bacterium]
MKQTVTLLLLAVMCCSLLLSMTACEGADQSGEWGAYYQAFRAFSGKISSEVDSICLCYEGVEEENQKKLYDLFYEYCDDRGKRIYTGNETALFEAGKVNLHTNEFTDACLVSFCDVTWSEDRTKVDMTVSVRSNLFVDAANVGGIVHVVKKGDGWKATVSVNEKQLKQTGVGAYAEVLAYFMRPEIQIDPMSNRFIALDPEGMDGETLKGVRDYTRSVFGKQGMSFLEYTWEGLKEDGYVVDGRFTEGYHMSFGKAKWNADGTEVYLTCWMTKADLEALGGNFTVGKTKNGWEILNVEEMIS